MLRSVSSVMPSPSSGHGAAIVVVAPIVLHEIGSIVFPALLAAERCSTPLIVACTALRDRTVVGTPKAGPMDGEAYVETALNFASPDLRGFRAPGGYTQAHGKLASGEAMRPGGTTIKLWNARLLDPAPTLQSHGFQLITHEEIPWDLQDMDTVRGEFYSWCRDTIQRATNCQEVRGGSNEFRRPPGLPTPNGSGGGYASGIHSDMSPGIELSWVSGQDDRCDFNRRIFISY